MYVYLIALILRATTSFYPSTLLSYHANTTINLILSINHDNCTVLHNCWQQCHGWQHIAYLCSFSYQKRTKIRFSEHSLRFVWEKAGFTVVTDFGSKNESYVNKTLLEEGWNSCFGNASCLVFGVDCAVVALDERGLQLDTWESQRADQSVPILCDIPRFHHQLCHFQNVHLSREVIHSKTNGLWSNGSIWTSGQIPGRDDTVAIHHDVMVDLPNVSVHTVVAFLLFGTLRYSINTKTSL